MILNNIAATFIPVTDLDLYINLNIGRVFDDRLCIIACLRDHRKNNLEGFTSDQFIFAVKNPFEGSSTNTIRRTENEILATNNIVDFYPQSCRVALTSKAKEINADVGEIIRR